jgi:hypothetical protein
MPANFFATPKSVIKPSHAKKSVPKSSIVDTLAQNGARIHVENATSRSQVSTYHAGTLSKLSSVGKRGMFGRVVLNARRKSFANSFVAVMTPK